MLEVGSYTGMFLKIARERGFDVLGVEPSVWASSYARDKLQVPTVTGSADSIPADTKPFDVVCSWDVLEHVADPMAQLKQINRRLIPGGIYAFSTLDYGNWYPRLMGERWPWLMDMHLYYFDQKVLKQMLAAAGFRVVHQQAYSHIITFEYFLKKLAALGVPGSEVARASGRTDAAAQAEGALPLRRYPALRLREDRRVCLGRLIRVPAAQRSA